MLLARQLLQEAEADCALLESIRNEGALPSARASGSLAATSRDVPAAALEGLDITTSDRPATAVDQLVGGVFGDMVRSLQWLPVLAKPPYSKYGDGDRSDFRFIPWPQHLHNHVVLCTSGVCRPASDAWLCSATLR